MSQYLNKTGLETLVAKIKELVNSVQSNLSKSYNELLIRISNAQKDLNDKISNTKSIIDAYTVNGKKISTNPTLTKADVGLGNVANVDAVPKSDIGVTVAPLDSGKVPAAYLPGYVDDIKDIKIYTRVDGYTYVSSISSAINFGYDATRNCFIFFSDNKKYSEVCDYLSTDMTVYGEKSGNKWIPVADKIYVDEFTNRIYRWTSTNLVEIPSALSLGETANTAYPGNKGKENKDNINNIFTNAVFKLGVSFNNNTCDITGNNKYNNTFTNCTIPQATNNNAGLMTTTMYNSVFTKCVMDVNIKGLRLHFKGLNPNTIPSLSYVDFPVDTNKSVCLISPTIYNKIVGIASGATADSAIPTSEIEALFN